jgi:poly-beta-hydroxyalkanoate depolymerase
MQADTEFIVDTECGRHFCWSAPDYEYLVRKIHDRGYKATFIKPYEEYLAEMELAAEFMKREEERELKESA